MLVHIENLKTQRDLYLSFRDLFIRHDRKSSAPLLAVTNEQASPKIQSTPYVKK
jgi:hypothetical protein